MLRVQTTKHIVACERVELCACITVIRAEFKTHACVLFQEERIEKRNPTITSDTHTHAHTIHPKKKRRLLLCVKYHCLNERNKMYESFLLRLTFWIKRIANSQLIEYTSNTAWITFSRCSMCGSCLSVDICCYLLWNAFVLRVFCIHVHVFIYEEHTFLNSTENP